MTYLESIKYLESFINYEKIAEWPYKEFLKLDRFRNFVSLIGNPQHSLRCIHVAGTKGKGSTSAFITYILRQAGYKTGLYTSPHLSDFRERIRILNPKPILNPGSPFEGMIPKKDMIGLVKRLKPAIERFNRVSRHGPLSLFEVYTTLAFVYFKERGVDFAVLETGLGGRLDATNVCRPLVCAITPISYEHTQKLGNTLRAIAGEKAGIIKASATVILAPQEKEARGVFIDRIRQTGARLHEVGKDISYQKTKKGFRIKGVTGEFRGLKIKLLGRHQLINATVAVGAVEALREHGLVVGTEAIRLGLNNTLWPGRCEVVWRKPQVVLDGAQNVASAQAIKETIINNFKYARLILVLGISKDKDLLGICNELHGLSDEVILTKANNPRAASPDELTRYFKDKNTHITKKVKEANLLAHRLAKKGDLILFTGSLFVVGEARDLFYGSMTYA